MTDAAASAIASWLSLLPGRQAPDRPGRPENPVYET